MFNQYCLATLVSIALLSSGCMSNPSAKLPPELQFQSVPASANTASIVGHQQPRFTRVYADRTAYIANINGKRVMAGVEGWNQPLVIPAGTHQLQLVYKMGGHHATTTLNFDAEAGKAYQLNFITDIGTSVWSGNSYVDFWVEDQTTRKPVSGVVRAEPPRVPATVYIPIVVPK